MCMVPQCGDKEYIGRDGSCNECGPYEIPSEDQKDCQRQVCYNENYVVVHEMKLNFTKDNYFLTLKLPVFSSKAIKSFGNKVLKVPLLIKLQGVSETTLLAVITIILSHNCMAKSIS